MKNVTLTLQTASVLAVALLFSQLASAQTAWQGTNAVSASTNWSDANNWSAATTPDNADVKFFDGGAAGVVATINNVVDNTFFTGGSGGAINSLQYGNSNGFHTTLISSGVTLTIANGLSVGTGNDAGGNQAITATITGTGGKVLVNGGNLGVSQGSATDGSHRSTLDLSGLDTFTASVTTLGVGASGVPTGTPNARATGTLILAKTNTITVSGTASTSGILVGDPQNTGPSGNSLLLLGNTNAIYANIIQVGARKGGTSTHTMIFNPAVTNASPVAYFRASDTVSPITTWSIGDDFNAGGGSTVANGLVNFTGGRVDALITTNIIGRGQGGAGNRGTGTLTFEAGTIGVDTMVIGYQSGAAAANGPGTGTVNVNGTGTLSVGNLLYLTRATIAGAAANTTVGTLNVNAGTIAANTITNGGGGSSTLTMSRGTLYLTNAMAGPGFVNFNLTNSVLHLNVNGSPAATNIIVTNLTCGVAPTTTNHIVIDSVTNILLTTTVTLIQYVNGTNAANFILDSAPAGYTTSLDVSLAGQIRLNISPINNNAARQITWNGTDQGAWNVSSLDWKTNGVNTSFNFGDAVRFDDSLAGTPSVNLQIPVTFAAMVVSNNANSYTLSGAGKLSGTNGLVKQGGNSLLIDNSTPNDFGGGVLISAGTVQVGNGDANGSLGAGKITNNAALVFNRSDSDTVTNTISGTGSLTQNGSGTLTLSGVSSYTGPTLVNNGTLLLNGSLTSALTNAGGTTLAGSGSNSGSVDVGGTLQPGTAGGAGTFTAGNTIFESGATGTFDVNSANTVGGGVNDLLQVNGNLTLNNNSLTVNFIGVPSAGASYRLANFTGGLTGTFNSSVTLASGAPRPTATLSYATANQINVTFSGFANLVWTGNGTEWDAGLSQSWSNETSTVTPDFFYNGDSVLFDDTAVATTVDIASGVMVVPTFMTNSSIVNAFTISGAGQIGGIATLVKDGDSTLTLSTTNTFTGPVIVRGGILKVGSNAALGATNGFTYVTNGATLDVNGAGGGTGTRNLAETILIAGSGVGGNGAIINSGSRSDNSLQRVIMVGDATIGAPNGRYDIHPVLADPTFASLSTGGQPYKLTKKGIGQFSLFSCTVDPALGDIEIAEGVMDFGDYTTGLGNPSSNLIVDAGATLSFFANNPPNTTTSLWNKVFILNGNGSVNTLQNRGGSGHTLIGPVQLNGSCILSGTLTNKGPISGTGSLTKNGNNTLYVYGANTYEGDTTINAGSIALVGLSIISNSPNLILSATNSTLDVSARTPAVLVLNNNQTLSGNGNVLGSLTVGANAAISPGISAVGALTVTNIVTLSGTTTMELDQDGLTNDVIRGAAQINYGGLLSVTSLNSALTNGSNFKLFYATAYNGAFTNITSTPALDPSLAWDTSTLTSDGTLRVKLATVSQPSFSSVKLSGTNLIVSGTNAPLTGNYYVLASTNVTIPLSNWTRLATNTFDGTGGFSFTNGISAGQPREFLILQVP